MGPEESFTGPIAAKVDIRVWPCMDIRVWLPQGSQATQSSGTSPRRSCFQLIDFQSRWYSEPPAWESTTQLTWPRTSSRRDPSGQEGEGMRKGHADLFLDYGHRWARTHEAMQVSLDCNVSGRRAECGSEKVRKGRSRRPGCYFVRKAPIQGNHLHGDIFFRVFITVLYSRFNDSINRCPLSARVTATVKG